MERKSNIFVKYSPTGKSKGIKYICDHDAVYYLEHSLIRYRRIDTEREENIVVKYAYGKAVIKGYNLTPVFDDLCNNLIDSIKRLKPLSDVDHSQLDYVVTSVMFSSEE